MSGQIQCENCGGQAVLGYPKCPHCQHPMPKVEAPLNKMARKKSETRGGTTAVMPEQEGSSRLPWIVGALCLIGLLVFWATRPSDALNSKVEKTRVAPAAGATQKQAVAQPTAWEAPDAQEAAARAGLDRASAALTNTLADERLWSTVSIDDKNARVTIQSSSCEDSAMRTTLEAELEPFRELGITSLECIAKHGGLVFEISL